MMRKLIAPAVLGGAVVLLTLPGVIGGEAEAPSTWSMKATIIEACSCPMFCQCYFNPEPSAHHGNGDQDHFCRFNNAFRVSEGHHGEVDLSGALFWVAGDLGDDFSDGEMNWAVLMFDPGVGEAQRGAIAEILGHVYPVKWSSFEMGEDAEMEWELTDTRAEARLAGGKVAEVILNRMANHDHNPVIKGLNYWGVPRHDGFVLMPNEVEAYRVGEKAFEYGGGNGFTVSFEITSDDVSG